MKSRITIEVDFDNGNQSAIFIKQDRTSDDVRDKLINDFIQKFAHQKGWCRFEFVGENTHKITPIGIDELYEQSRFMSLVCYDLNKDAPKTPLRNPLHFDISEILTELKFGRPAEAQKLIDGLINVWDLWASKKLSEGQCKCTIDGSACVLNRSITGADIHKEFNHIGPISMKSTGAHDIMINDDKTVYHIEDGDAFYTFGGGNKS